MENLENSVESFDESAYDDGTQVHEEEQDTSVAISSLLEGAKEDEASQESAPEEKDEGADKVSGGIRGRLLAADRKGYERGQQEAQRQWEQERAKYEERLSRLEDIEIKQEARELAAKEKISESIAERLIRAERGKPAPVQQQEHTQTTQDRPRDSQGRFVAQERSQSDQRAKELFAQAQNIKRMTGQDVMERFNSDEQVRRRVARGEIDFYDLAREMSESDGGRRRVPPVVPRTLGGAHSSTIANLSDAQFDLLDRNLDEGVVYDMRR